MTYCKNNPAFDKILREMGELHDRKNEDYSDKENPLSVFEETASIVDIPIEKVFMVLIAIKMIRLRVLLKKGKKPNFETKRDTKIDLANYSAFLASVED